MNAIDRARAAIKDFDMSLECDGKISVMTQLRLFSAAMRATLDAVEGQKKAPEFETQVTTAPRPQAVAPPPGEGWKAWQFLCDDFDNKVLWQREIKK